LNETQKVILVGISAGYTNVESIAQRYNYPSNIISVAVKQLINKNQIEYVNNELTIKE
jgi:hypothetical protein